MEQYRNKYRNDSTRLKDRDYGPSGFYFVTICTQNRENYFGHIEWVHNVGTQNFASQHDGHFASVDLTEIRKIAQQYWIEIPNHFPFVVLDKFIIMPNHVHGILCFNKSDYRGGSTNTFGPQSQNRASVIRGYKAATKKYATLNTMEFAWQKRYHERIVRMDELMATRRYIENNPAKWIAVNYVGTQNFASLQE